eukprot:gb/GECH01003967.1/.p1 GENE.gb/GECH01003967.1/~~gb/GECH01003967.1/.p1  ORF type:complete len:1212 (+),score=249.40 gb/GECH01003967.1/:1-3636(+)
MRQVGVIPSGVQVSPFFVTTGNEKWFAYTSSLAIYVFRMEDYSLHRVITGLYKPVVSISCFKFDSWINILSVITTDSRLYLWNMETGSLYFSCLGSPVRLTAIESSPTDTSIVALGAARGGVKFFDVKTKDSVVFNSEQFCHITVTRQNRRSPVNYLVGTEKGQIFLANCKTAKGQKIDNHTSRVIALEWDPLSDNYFIAGWEDGTIKLFDSETLSCMFEFDKTTQISSLDWNPSIPGGFISADAKSGILRCWNVSKKSPESVVNIRNFGFREFRFLTENKILAAFSDGAVGVYNWKTRKFEFITQGGHTETVFDCEFSNIDRNVFATSSYDKTIKLWDVGSMECVDNLVGSDHIIYSVSWHPSENKLASSLRSGEIWIWDVDKATPISKFKIHNDTVFRVAWNQNDPSLLASASKNKRCVIFREDGKEIRSYKHPKPVFGIDWNPFNSNTLATGCLDGIVRILNVNSTSPTNILKGHEDSVYNVKWSPLKKNVLISGSNDNTIIVWFLDKQEKKVLRGHSDNVRALEWSPELPNICFSGSWDGTIRMWDIMSGNCLFVATDHCADIYGLTIHPQRPFFMVSSSRDTTIRFWNMDTFAPVSKIRTLGILSNNPENMISTPDKIDENTQPHKLCGKRSKELFSHLKTISSPAERYRLLHEFFSLPFGQSNLWHLARAHMADEYVEPNDNTIKHEKNLFAAAETKAKDLESTKGKKILGLNKIKAAMKEAAEIHLKMGNMKQYCDIMVDIGEWERALSIAPAVSLKYWRELTLNYADRLSRTKQTDSVPFLLSSNQIQSAIDFHLKREEPNDALLIAKASTKNNFRNPLEEYESKEMTSPSPRNSNGIISMEEIGQMKAKKYMNSCFPIMAASAALSVGDIQNAYETLINANEILSAYSLCKVLGMPLEDDIMFTVAEHCLHLHLNAEALKIISELRNRDLAIGLLCIVNTDLESMYSKAGFQTPQFYAENIPDSDDMESVRFMLLGRNWTEAAQKGLTMLRDIFSQDVWPWQRIQEILTLIQFIPLDNIDSSYASHIIAYSHLCGGFQALWKQYYDLAPVMFGQAKDLVSSVGEFPVMGTFLEFMQVYALSFAYPKEALTKSKSMASYEELDSETKETARNLHSSLANRVLRNSPPWEKQAKRKVLQGPNIPLTGENNVPIVSCITKKELRPPFMVIDSRSSCLSIDEALRWTEVNPFPPVSRGVRMVVMPF